uniref:NADH-ubiquinone oxidoreductase chain 4 n=1 Tax=Omalonyx unguis TaxID=1851496 RepID=A0A8F7GK36_9EUPU|nr:NADH dehydrogenase subunit 4 [Omalonyx unguis]
MMSLIFSGSVLMLLNSYWETFMILTILLFLLSLMIISGSSFSMSMDCFFYMNNINLLMLFLTIFLVIISYLSTLKEKSSNYMISIFFLMMVLVFTFITKDLIYFYIFFEISLIPTLYLIISWGYQPERLQAGNYMMIYTVCASLPLLIIILFYKMKYSTSNVYLMSHISNFITNPFIISLMIMAFLVKLPMYGLHLWLPKAHVEAPLAGSMLLAGILLKLGGYGLFLMMNIFNFTNMNFLFLVISLAIWGSVLSTFMCMQQNDLKAMVAYSSVAHMGILVSCILLNNFWGFCSLKMIMISHGFISPGMFFMAMLTYKMSSSRSLSYSKGLLSISPILCLFWFLFCFCNMAAPPSLNFFGEMMFVPIITFMGYMNYIILALLMFMGVLFSMYMYTSVNHGMNIYIKPCNEVKSSDLLSLLIHLLTIILILKLNIFIY